MARRAPRAAAPRPLPEPRRALLAHRGHALADVGPGQVEELELERGVEDRPRPEQPLVERRLRVRDRSARARREPASDLERPLLELLLGHAERDEPDALRLRAVDLLAQEQVIF